MYFPEWNVLISINISLLFVPEGGVGLTISQSITWTNQLHNAYMRHPEPQSKTPPLCT